MYDVGVVTEQVKMSIQQASKQFILTELILAAVWCVLVFQFLDIKGNDDASCIQGTIKGRKGNNHPGQP